MEPAPDFLALLPSKGLGDYDGPVYYLWTFDPDTGEITLEHDDDKHRADAPTHNETDHPGTEQGYAYRISRGWRITNAEHRPVKDPFVLHKILRTLRRKHS